MGRGSFGPLCSLHHERAHPMSSFVCPTDPKHPMRFEFNGRGRKAYCNTCKTHYMQYPRRGTWEVLPVKEKIDGQVEAHH